MAPKGKTVVKPIGRSNGSAKPSSSTKPVASSSKATSAKPAPSTSAPGGLRQPGQGAGRPVPPSEPNLLDASRRVPEYRVRLSHSLGAS